MHLKELSLIDYRNYVKLELKFSSNLIVCQEGMPREKPIYWSQSFYPVPGDPIELPGTGAYPMGSKESVIRSLVDKRGPSLIEITLSQKDKKKININSMTAQRLGELMGHINSVLFSPEI